MKSTETAGAPPAEALPGLGWSLRLGVRTLHWADAAFLVAWVAALLYLIVAFWGQSYDDVFLAFRYAKNIEQGYGFVFNPGEHFLGTPAPLFVLLLVLGHTLLPFLTIPQVGTLISAAGLACTGGALYLIGRQQQQRLVGALAALLAVFNPLTLLVFGGETPLYLAFITTAIWCYTSARYDQAAVLLGLALMNRSEALVPIGLLLGLATLERRRLPLRMLLITALTLAPWLLFAFWQFGSPLTNSFTAKISQVAAGAERYPFGLVRWIQQIVLTPDSLFWAVLPLLLLGAVSLVFTGRAWRLIVAWTALQTVAYACLPIPFYHWYAAQVGVLAAVLAALGAVELPGLLRRTARALASAPPEGLSLARQWTRLYRVALVVVALMLPPALYAHLSTTRGYQKAWPHGPSNQIYQQAGEWFAANTPPDARIAYLEIGQIAFYSDRYIIDTLGLVTPEVAPQIAKSNWLWPLLRYKPDYIIYNPMFKDWTDGKALLRQEWFQTGFHKVAEIALPPYPTPLEIYQRLPDASIPDPVE
ncbi:MAG: hypothetical protein OHK0022_13510 [Roseiflexaceae bacterium]